MDWANGFFPITKTLQLRNWLPCKLVKWGMEGRELSEPAEGISAEVEQWDSMISTSFVTLRMDERFDTITCAMFLLKCLIWVGE